MDTIHTHTIHTHAPYTQDPRDEVFDEEGVSNDMLDFLNELFQGEYRVHACVLGI